MSDHTSGEESELSAANFPWIDKASELGLVNEFHIDGYGVLFTRHEIYTSLHHIAAQVKAESAGCPRVAADVSRSYLRLIEAGLLSRTPPTRTSYVGWLERVGMIARATGSAALIAGTLFPFAVDESTAVNAHVHAWRDLLQYDFNGAGPGRAAAGNRKVAHYDIPSIVLKERITAARQSRLQNLLTKLRPLWFCLICSLFLMFLLDMLGFFPDFSA